MRVLDGKIKRSGYIYLKRRDHPNCGKQGYVAEHRIVMEEYLGRHLTKKEVVHHINDNREDNRIENLKLFESHGQHTKLAHPEIYIDVAAINKGKKPPNYARKSHICKMCGREFLVNPNRNRKYCKKECYWESKKGNPPPNTEGLKLGRGWNKGMKMKSDWGLKGKNHPHYKHGKYSKYPNQ